MNFLRLFKYTYFQSLSLNYKQSYLETESTITLLITRNIRKALLYVTVNIVYSKLY